ncbi:DUF2341 domain-containing protein [Methanophagales archaeon]|nr:MAG: DUF2341 domain-containing protein [Methanophagales archaeon]
MKIAYLIPIVLLVLTYSYSLTAKEVMSSFKINKFSEVQGKITNVDVYVYNGDRWVNVLSTQDKSSVRISYNPDSKLINYFLTNKSIPIKICGKIRWENNGYRIDNIPEITIDGIKLEKVKTITRDNYACSIYKLSIDKNARKKIYNKLDWWNYTFAYRRKIYIKSTVNTDVENVLIPIEIDTQSLISAGKMQSDCDDLRFTDANGNPINYSYENKQSSNYGCNTETTVVYVDVSEVKSDNSTYIYMYYGNEEAEMSNTPKSSWIKAFFPMSVANANSGFGAYKYTSSGGYTFTTGCQLYECYKGGSYSYNSVNDTDNTLLDESSEYSIAVWFKNLDSCTSNVNLLCSRYDNGDDEYQVLLANWHLREDLWDGSLTQVDSNWCPDTLDWHFLVISQNSTNIYFIIDGVINATAPKFNTDVQAWNIIGAGYRDGSYRRHWQGYIDNVIYTDNVLTEDWSKLMYDFATSDLITIGEEEAKDTIAVILISPENNATSNESSIDFVFKPISYAGDIYNCSLYTNESGAWQIEETITDVQNNTNNTINHEINTNGTYLWSVGCYNSTTLFMSDENRTLIVAIPPDEPEETETTDIDFTIIELGIVFIGLCLMGHLLSKET